MRIAALVLVSAVALAACGSARQEPLPSASPVGGAVSKATLVAIGSAGATVIDSSGTVHADLGDVIGAPGWLVAYSVVAAQGSTTLRRIDTGTGTAASVATLNGEWHAVSSYASSGPSGFSAGGRWLTLQAASPADRTALLVVDTDAKVPAKRIDVAGRFGFDAISDNGESLYLIQHFSGTQYKVRVVDVRSGLLMPDAVVDVKQLATTANADGTMNGTYTSSAAGLDGQWFFSVYQHPSMGPYIHALNTTSRIAECILDLPTFGKSGPLELAKQPFWSVAVGRRADVTRLYAVNAVLGQAALIDPDAIKVKKTATFSVPAPTGDAPAFRPHPAAVVSGDGYRLYALGERGIVMLDAMDLSLRATFEPGKAFRSLAIAPDNGTLFALGADGTSIAAFDARTGRPIATIALRAAADSIAVEAR